MATPPPISRNLSVVNGVRKSSGSNNDGPVEKESSFKIWKLLSRKDTKFAALAMLSMSLRPGVARAGTAAAAAAAPASVISLFRTLGLMANSIVIGVPIWVFFLQAPCLFKLMGRDKFLLPMMTLTDLLFRWTLPICSALSVVCSVAVDCGVGAAGNCPPGSFCVSQVSAATKAAIVSLVAILINSLYIVPRALKAGKKATKPTEKSKTVTDFAVSGGSKTNTKALHQSVVVFVLVHVVSAVLHLKKVV